MRGAATRARAVDKLVTALQAGQCYEATARELYALGREAVALALLAAGVDAPPNGSRVPAAPGSRLARAAAACRLPDPVFADTDAQRLHHGSGGASFS